MECLIPVEYVNYMACLHNSLRKYVRNNKHTSVILILQMYLYERHREDTILVSIFI